MKNLLTLVLVGILITLAAIPLILPSSYIYKPGTLMPPLIIRDHQGSPQEWLARLLEQEGGLPKSDAALTHSDMGIGFAVATEKHPIENWEIEQITVSSPHGLLEGAIKGEMVYMISVDFRAHFTDGDCASFKWHTWRYGWFYGLLAIDSGGGPAGDIMRVASNNVTK